MNIIKRIRTANAGREPERLAMKYHALRESPFAFFRGTCRLFYDRLAASGFATDAPAVWCCGDLHIENFGCYKGDNRQVYFDINDFDEAALAPASWELVRLVTSVHVGLKALGMTEERRVSLAENMISQYAHTLAGAKASWVERDEASGIVRELLDQLRERKRVDFLDSRTRLVRRRRRLLIDGEKTLYVSDEQRKLVTAAANAFAHDQSHAAFFQVRDVARRIAGTGSLGVSRYVVLVEGHGSPDRNYLFDLKQSTPSALGRVFAALQPRWESQAQRVTGVQHLMQAVTAAFLHPLVLAGQPYTIRALQPSEDRLPFDRFDSHAMFHGAIELLAECTAAAHLRSSGRQGSANADELVAFASKKKWQRQVARTALAMAGQVDTDWDGYGTAYDAGQFHS